MDIEDEGRELTVQEKELQRAKNIYMHNSSECPFCKSTNLHCANALIDAGGAIQDVVCNDCSAAWMDVYSMTDVIMMRKGNV